MWGVAFTACVGFPFSYQNGGVDPSAHPFLTLLRPLLHFAATSTPTLPPCSPLWTTSTQAVINKKTRLLPSAAWGVV